ncbi:lipoprotein LpqH [Mycolicibacterium pulveris]|uniref:lipoprotein LpqH n=1 Tax=Mycolicibacterium pulveris TaxID=36813 RepID=UPI003CF9511D
MKHLWLGGAALLVLAGCSSHPPEYEPGPGELVAGTAEVAVNDQEPETTEAVQCDSTGPLTTITTGDQRSGVTVMVSNQDELTAESVNINNVGGFTGSYNAGVGETAAEVTMTGRTYDITGTADGFDTANPSFRVPGTFAIKVSC